MDDPWVLAADYAAHMLPGIFTQDDPLLQVRFALEGRLTLERILADIQQIAEWEHLRLWNVEVNHGETRGFQETTESTEKDEDHGKGKDQNSLRDLCVSVVKEPCAGAFDGWPQTAAELKLLDPCCGSGRFLVEEFHMLRKMRMAEEGLSSAKAAVAVLRDNLHGLEVDAPCIQIAAWKAGVPPVTPSPAHPFTLSLNLACTGIPVGGKCPTRRLLHEFTATTKCRLVDRSLP